MGMARCHEYWHRDWIRDAKEQQSCYCCGRVRILPSWIQPALDKAGVEDPPSENPLEEAAIILQVWFGE